MDLDFVVAIIFVNSLNKHLFEILKFDKRINLFMCHVGKLSRVFNNDAQKMASVYYTICLSYDIQ